MDTSARWIASYSSMRKPPGNRLKTFAGFSRLPRDAIEQPGTGEGPVAFGRCLRDSKSPGSFGQRKADKETEFHQFGLLGLFPGELVERLVDAEQGQRVRFGGDLEVLQ